MNSLKDFLYRHPKKICAALAISAVLGGVWKWQHVKIRSWLEKTYPKDTVVHHQIARGPRAPSLTPFALKLETYLRMAKIPYINEFDSMFNLSSKKKLTWIEYNGEKVADSEFCIKYLNRKFNIDLNTNFSEEEKVVAYSMQKMLEENTYWALALLRWPYGSCDELIKALHLPRILIPLGRRTIRKQAYAQGLGRHTKSEVLQILNEDIAALSKFMGSKKFLLGDTPCQADCAVFGILSQMYWHPFDEDTERIIKKFPNLCSYCERMKRTFWPDWNDCITHGGTRPAIK